MLRQALQRGLIVGEVLAMVDGGVADDVDGQDAVFVDDGDGLDDQGLVDDAAHGDGVVAGHEDEVGERAVANRHGWAERRGGQVVLEGDVAHVQGEDGGVGDVDLADHVGSVGLGGQLDAEGGDVEAAEFVQAIEGRGGIVGHGGVGELHLVQGRAAVDVDLHALVVQHGGAVGCECSQVCDGDILVDETGAVLGRVQSWKLDIGIRITATQRQRGVERI